ncbi:hypothetical protein RFI_21443, partial [Reticulomyxa filosa]
MDICWRKQQSLKDHMKQNSFSANLGVLKIIELITSRFVGEEKTLPMVDSIKYICREFGSTWLSYLKQWTQGLKDAFGPGEATTKPNWNEGQVNELKCQVECVETLVLIFHDLISVDWIEFFDEYQKEWMPILQYLLTVDDKYKLFGNPVIHLLFFFLLCKFKESASPLEGLRTNVVKTLHVLVTNYDEEIQYQVAAYVEFVAKMVARLNDSERYDTLVAESIQFLTA